MSYKKSKSIRQNYIAPKRTNGGGKKTGIDWWFDSKTALEMQVIDEIKQK